MKAIAAVDKNWAIGKDGALLVSIPEDMKFFRETTSGHVVVMGRKTLESFPGKRPLKNRVNIVLTGDVSYVPCGEARIAHSIEQLKELLSVYDGGEVFVIGGESVYRQLLPLCDTAYITKIDTEYDADAHFPNLDSDSEWVLSDCGERKKYQGTAFRFCEYRKKA